MKVLNGIPAGTVPYLSVDELIISKIVSSGQTQLPRPPAKVAKDIKDAKALLEAYPETTFTTENHRQIAEKFRRQHNLDSNEKGVGLKNAMCKRDGASCLTRKQTKRQSLTRAAKVFQKLAVKYGLEGTIKLKGASFPKLLQTLKLKLPQLKAGSGTTLTAGLYFSNVATAFLTDATSRMRWEAATALVPVVRCVTQGLADVERERNKATTWISATICGLADAISFIPLGAPFAVVIHWALDLIRIVETGKRPSPAVPAEKLHESYTSGWTRVLEDGKSHFSSNSFIRNLTAEIDAQKLDVAVRASATVFELHAVSLYGNNTGPDAVSLHGNNTGDSEKNVDKAPDEEGDEVTDEDLATLEAVPDETEPLENDYPESLAPQPVIDEAISNRTERLKKHKKEEIGKYLENKYKEYDEQFSASLKDYYFAVLQRQAVQQDSLRDPNLKGILSNPHSVAAQQKVRVEAGKLRDESMNKLRSHYPRGSGLFGLGPGPRPEMVGGELDKVFNMPGTCLRNPCCASVPIAT